VRIPLGIDLPVKPADPAGSKPPGLLFIGNFVHPPNVDAAERLASRILPSIRKVYPETRLTVVGPQPPVSLQRRDGEGVTVAGEVPDVRPYLESAAVVVAPLRFGGGMRVKVAEALAAGKAVVASPIAVAGLEVTSGEHLMVAETDDEIVEACTMLLGNTSARVELASRARVWAVRHLGWDGPVAAFEELYASLVG
jgi:glycosyltransferase involved in cell wall biosynthesis